MCVNGDWLEKPTVCEKDPDYVEWDPSLSTCKLPKKANKENQSGGGKWHCKAQLINPNERSVEAENALAAEEGYELITEKSTIAGLVSEDFMRRWKSTKGKEPYVICKLKCHDGYELEGSYYFNLKLKIDARKYKLYCRTAHLQLTSSTCTQY